MRALLVFFCLVSGLTTANAQEDFGMVMDVAGRVVVHRGAENFPADLGRTVLVGDRFELSDTSRLTIVSFQDCREWLLTGPSEATTRWTRIEGSGLQQPEPGRRLPVCYSQQELEVEDPGVLGGLVLRGIPEDPVAGLRREFDSGQAPNSTLVTLIMHDLANDDPDRAKPYMQELQRRAPNSAFVKRLSGLFP